MAPGVEQPLAGWIYWAQARNAYERDDIDAALAAAERCVKLCGAWGNYSMQARGYLVQAQALRARGVPYILSSGYDDMSRFPEHLRDAPRIEKPYGVDALADAMDAALRRFAAV